MTQSSLSHRRRVVATARAVVAAVVMLLGAATAQAQTVKFKTINDAVPSKYFDAATTAPDPSNLNRLIIGFNTGLDPATFLTSEFVAFFNRKVAMDTISFSIKAPFGFYVSKITYTQSGAGSTCRTCSSAGAATWVVAGHAASLGVFTTNPNLTATADVTAMKLVTVPVSISESLFSQTGSVMVTSADVLVQVVPR